MAHRSWVRDPGQPTVSPRLVWGGIGGALAGLAVAGVALVSDTRWLVWVGAAATGVGLVVAWRGGVMYDTRGQEPPHHEVRELMKGGNHLGVSPASRVVGDEVERRAAASTERRREVLARSEATPRPPLRPLAAYGLLAVGGWLFLAHRFLGYPFTIAGQDSALREVGFAVVVALCALRLRLRTRSIVASIVCLLSGCLLVLTALFLPHDSAIAKVNEIATGVVVLGLTAMTLP